MQLKWGAGTYTTHTHYYSLALIVLTNIVPNYYVISTNRGTSEREVVAGWDVDCYLGVNPVPLWQHLGLLGSKPSQGCAHVVWVRVPEITYLVNGGNNVGGTSVAQL